jgi:hypothetical protein
VLALDIIIGFEGRQGKKSRFHSTSGTYYLVDKSKKPPKSTGKSEGFYLF